MIGSLLLAALLAAPRPAPTTAPAAPPADVAELDARLEAVLSRIHGRATPQAWRALGPGAVPELARVAEDPAELPSRRARAVEGLSYLGGARAEAVLRALVADGASHWLVRIEALRGVGRVLPAADAAALLLPVLRGAGHPVERAVAADVLADRAPVAGCAAVRSRAAAEAASDRAGYDRALGRCAAQGR